MSASTGRVAGKVALVTGAGRGQGRAHAVALAAEGADVVICDVDGAVAGNMVKPATPEDLQETVAAIKQVRSDTRILSRVADVRDPAVMDDLAAEAVAELGGIDVVVANAGIINWGEFTDYPVELFQQVLDVNLTGVFNTCKATVPHLIEGGKGGSIVLISSAAGIKGQPFTPGYTAAKHGVVGLMRGLANELGRHSIRVNSIHPAGVKTAMSDVLGLFDLIVKYNTTMGPVFMNTLPTPVMPSEDISHAVIFLASDESRYVTGLELKVDLGMTNR